VHQTATPTLLFADTHTSADQRYFSRVDVHDPFIAFSTRRKRITAQNALEFGRILKAGVFDEVLQLEKWREKAGKRWPKRVPGIAEIIAELAQYYRVKQFRVPDDFPAALYVDLRKLGLDLQLSKGPLFPEREVKTSSEAAAIREGNRLSSVGFSVAERMLKRARPRSRMLMHDGHPLTSERVRHAIECAVLAEGGNCNGTTIVAGGSQACDPHHRGSGLLRPNELIIIDIFPRVTKSGYFGDMTRTYLRGRATEAQRRLVTTVQAGQRLALDAIRSGADGREIHGSVVALFTSEGFETRRTPKGSVGFFHGTGHGLGLAVHELPRLGGAVSMPLKKGSVVTVEPGLYYPDVGGCRIEDVVQVTDRAPKMLSNHSYDWEFG
jgi:Xaa-Pro aminopeptidase